MGSEKPTFPCLFLSKHRLTKGSNRKGFSRSQNKEVWISQGKSLFLNQSLCTLKRQEILCLNSGFCLLSKSFGLRSPSVLICKQPFLNDLTDFQDKPPMLAHARLLVFLSHWPPWCAFVPSTLFPSKVIRFILPRCIFLTAVA